MSRGAKGGVSAAIGLAIALAVGGAAAAQDGVDTIKARRAAMKRMGSHMKGIGGFLEGGKDAGTAQAVALRGESVAAILERIPSLFPKGTSLADGLGETGAKPEIWREWDAFRAAAAKTRLLAQELSAAARTGDKQAIKAAMATLGKQGCGGCHRRFRKKVEHQAD